MPLSSQGSLSETDVHGDCGDEVWKALKDVTDDEQGHMHEDATTTLNGILTFVRTACCIALPR